MFGQERFIGRLQRHTQADPAVQIGYRYGAFGRRAEDACRSIPPLHRRSAGWPNSWREET